MPGRLRCGARSIRVASMLARVPHPYPARCGGGVHRPRNTAPGAARRSGRSTASRSGAADFLGVIGVKHPALRTRPASATGSAPPAWGLGYATEAAAAAARRAVFEDDGLERCHRGQRLRLTTPPRSRVLEKLGFQTFRGTCVPPICPGARADRARYADGAGEGDWPGADGSLADAAIVEAERGGDAGDGRMKFPRSGASVHIRSGAGGPGCISFRREKFIEYRRPRWRRWRASGGDVWAEAVARPQHADRFPLPAAFQGRRTASMAWAASAPARTAMTLLLRVPAGTEILEEDADTVIADLCARSVRSVLLAKRRQWRLWQSAFQILHPSGAAPCQSAASRSHRAHHLAAAQADRRRRAGGAAQCRQVDLPGGDLQRQAQDRRLSRSLRWCPISAWCGVDDGELVLADIPGLIEGRA
jgi:hypothetical protein